MESSAREVRNAYMRDYYKKNRDKFKASQKRYWEKKAKEIKNRKDDINNGQI